MTLIVAVTGPESIWLLADRRLTYENRPPKDDGRKVMSLETTDGVAILGYAGLGATRLGTEPADWMSAVLRGRNLPLEQSLNVLREAMRKQFPDHMVGMPGGGRPTHHVFVTAFLGEEPRLYSIGLVIAPDQKGYWYRCTRLVVNKPSVVAPRTPRLGVCGSGVPYLNQDRKWMRSLLRLVKAHDCGDVSPLAVADDLAKLNNEVHLNLTDKSVGPSCIVSWRFRKGGVQKGGGGHRFYTGTIRDASTSALPSIVCGRDSTAIVGVLTKQMAKQTGVHLHDRILFDTEAIAELNRLPDKPDEKLR